jgi:hypothetical protein
MADKEHFLPQERAFRVNVKDSRILVRRKRSVSRRLGPRTWEEQAKPMLAASNIQYEMADRIRAIPCGGVGAFHVLAQRVGLVKVVDRVLHLLKRHLPYQESDHVLNLAYNSLTGGTALDDITLHREDEAYLDALGAERVPAPTTAGDFARRFERSDVVGLQEGVNGLRVKVWRRRLSRAERRVAVVDADGLVAPTMGECKEGMDMAYKGVWGYHPLLVSLSNTSEPLYLVNRPGNRPSHEGAAEWLDRSVALVRQAFKSVCLRGDTDFALTVHFDRWSAGGVGFAFGIDAMPNLKAMADGIEEPCWKPLKRRIKRIVQTAPRERPENVKERIVREREYENIRLVGEHVAEFPYQPTACKRAYRVVVLRKNLSVERGERVLFDDVRYFFYITNLQDRTAEEIVFFANDRCNQENLIEQLKNGVHALRMPVDDLVSNWAYMVMASLAWTLKAWFALVVRDGERREELLRMEFRRFLHAIVMVPCQIVRGAGRVLYRILGYTDWTRTFLRTFDRIRQLEFT